MNTVPAEVRMGNQIALQFANLPAPQAAAAIARHIENFWDPRMRRDLEALVAAGDDSLEPLLVDAVGRLVAYPVDPEPDTR
jgi:formate dehydrogenase subunit delta